MRTDRRTQDKRTEIAHISDQVLQIAKDTGLPLILGAQLNRNANSKPTLENLKEAGNLEEDANTVLSIYNESREKDETAEGKTIIGLREVDLEIKALKNREGEVNQTATLIFDKYSSGLLTMIFSSLVVYAMKLTLGTVVITVWSNSRSKRSCTISICKRPKKPHRNPKPRAADDSGSKTRAASFNCNLSSASRSIGYSAPSNGNNPENTIGFGSA